MNLEQPEEGKDYLRKLPPGYHYPDDDPYILELKWRHPNVLWDRYLPAEVVTERINRYRESLILRNPEAARNFPRVNLPPGTWVYNATYECDWEEKKVKAGSPERLDTESSLPGYFSELSHSPFPCQD